MKQEIFKYCNCGCGGKISRVDDKIHNEYGPAVINNSPYGSAVKEGDIYCEWWYLGERVYVSSTKEFLSWIKLGAFR